ncbi:hypothetical protein T07_7680 [Trichinella nelsoni]|uniref:Uncharacterized protein n=1 Tax=Trichinella nelsoni TaxID=6336 RepID=A0A0V0RH74_9BILA|nr:hypothetical protein T07_7680 [Trichinella nelsoni]
MLDVAGVAANVIYTSRYPELSTKRSHRRHKCNRLKSRKSMERFVWKRMVLTSTSQHAKSNCKPDSVALSAVKPKREISDSAMNYARRRALQSTCPTSVMTAVISSAPSHMMY